LKKLKNVISEKVKACDIIQDGVYKEEVLIGNRVPRDYFITRGTGESDITVHAGSYHLALRSAGIEKANIMTYSSILPAIARKIEPTSAGITHGCVMDTIMAVANGNKGEQLSAGIIYGWLRDRLTGEKYGGLVCEHNGNYSEDEIVDLLDASLNEIYINGFEKDYEITDREVIAESFIPAKQYGTALVALCFTNYIYPVIHNFKDSFT